MTKNNISIVQRECIEDFLLRYAHTIDDGELERWPDFFTEDGSYKIITRENHDEKLPLGILSCEGRGMMKDRIIAMRQANIFEPHTYCHLIGKPQLEALSTNEFLARSNFTVIRTMQDGRTEIFAVGKYLDIIVMHDRRPLLKKRHAVLESRRVDILLVYPL